MSKRQWAIRAVLLCGTTAALLGLAHLFGWLSGVQIQYLAN